MRTINMHAAKTQLSRRAWSRPPHRDPFDRVLVAQAIVEPAILYTALPISSSSAILTWSGTSPRISRS
jgi:hypothetical protein